MCIRDSAWRTGEGGIATFNPFNTTYNYGLNVGVDYEPIGCDRNQNGGTPVKSYATRAIGLDATIKSLKLEYYKNIVNMLIQGNASFQQLSQDPALRTWGTGANINKVLQHPTFTPPAINQEFKKCTNYIG